MSELKLEIWRYYCYLNDVPLQIWTIRTNYSTPVWWIWDFHWSPHYRKNQEYFPDGSHCLSLRTCLEHTKALYIQVSFLQQTEYRKWMWVWMWTWPEPAPWPQTNLWVSESRHSLEMFNYGVCVCPIHALAQ